MKPRVLVIPINSLEAYELKGTISQYREYFNPEGIFSDVIALYLYDEGGVTNIAGIPAVRIKKRFIILDYLNLLIYAVLLIRKYKISIVRTYISLLEGGVTVLAGRICRIPSVVSLHGKDGKSIGARGFSKPLQMIGWLIVHLVLSLASGIWCVSGGVAEYARKSGTRKNRLRIIYNKVKVTDFLHIGHLREKARKELDYRPDDFVLIYVGRFSIDKRHHILIEAMKYLKDQGINSVKLLLVGGAPVEPSRGSMDGKLKKDYVRDRSSYDKIMKMIYENNLQELIKITGYISHDKIPYYISAADTYVIPMMRIGFGISIAEASAAGLPLIGTTEFQEGDHRLLIKPETSLTFEGNNPIQLAERIIQLKDDPELRRKLGTAARKNAMKFSWENIARREAMYYNEILSKQS